VTAAPATHNNAANHRDKSLRILLGPFDRPGDRSTPNIGNLNGNGWPSQVTATDRPHMCTLQPVASAVRRIRFNCLDRQKLSRLDGRENRMHVADDRPRQTAPLAQNINVEQWIA
jgi:hypothetical protein